MRKSRLLYIVAAFLFVMLYSCSSERDGMESKGKDTPVVKETRANDVICTVTSTESGKLSELVNAWAVANSKEVEDITQITVLGPIDAADVSFLGQSAIETWDLKEAQMMNEEGPTTVFDGPGTNYGHRTMVKKVIIPDGITKLGDSCLEYSDLEEIVLPESLEIIGFQAFRQSNLKHIVLPDKVKQIGYGAFSGCPLEEIVIPERVVVLENSLFSSCPLKSVTIKGDVTSIGDDCFRGSQFATIELPSTLETIGSWAFGDCLLSSVVFPESLRNIGYAAFDNSKLETIVLPDNLQSIYSDAFRSTPLKSVKLPKTISSTSSYMFAYCNSLESIEIPDGWLEVPGTMFFGCKKLKTVTLHSGLLTLGGSCFQECESLTGLEIPNTVTKIEDSAFKGCTSIQEITIPSSVTIVEEHAFSGCTGLKEITFPSSVTQIGPLVFQDCTNLQKIDLSSTQITRIPQYAFASCENLKEILYPENITVIEGYYTFSGTPLITSFTVPETVTSVEYGLLSGSSITTVYWKSAAKITDLGRSYSNVIVYAPTNATTETGISNQQIVAYGSEATGYVTTTAEIDDRKPFSCPIPIKADKVIYKRYFDNVQTYLGESAGWRTVSLPFQVTKFEINGEEIAPFAANREDAKPFWLRKLTSNGFVSTNKIEAGEGYILALPNNPDFYPEEYNLSGEVTFIGENVYIQSDDKLASAQGPNYTAYPSWKGDDSPLNYNINETSYGNYHIGGVFRTQERNTRPFEFYLRSSFLSNRAVIPVKLYDTRSVNVAPQTKGGKRKPMDSDM